MLGSLLTLSQGSGHCLSVSLDGTYVLSSPGRTQKEPGPALPILSILDSPFIF